MSDEHTASVMGCAGNTVVHTPHLDRLAAQGVLFDCAYTNSPLCVPARLSFTAGKYVSRVGAWSNDCWLPRDDIPSLPRLMNSAGYESYLCGKQHYDATHRYGFTEIGGNMNRAYMTGHGARRHAKDESVNTAGRDRRFKEFHVGDSSSILNHDRNVTAGVLGFLGARRRTDKPFFLFTGYLAPHFPLIVPKTYHDRYRGRVPMPVVPPGNVASQPRNYHHLRRGFGVVETDPDTVRLGRELMYGLTTWLDEEIGKVLAALGNSDVADNTIVIYTSDHGENMGEHHLWWKNCMYDHAARVPLIVSWPARWTGGQRRSGVCSLVDVVRTIAELGGADAPSDWDGDSLCPLLDDGTAPWKDFALSEYYAHNISSGFVMVRQGRYKYVYHTPADDEHPAERELYDMQADPGEFHNLAADPEQQGRVRNLHEVLLAELGENPDDIEQRCRADYARGYGRPTKGKVPTE
jgi:choline-sulfatase